MTIVVYGNDLANLHSLNATCVSQKIQIIWIQKNISHTFCDFFYMHISFYISIRHIRIMRSNSPFEADFQLLLDISHPLEYNELFINMSLVLLNLQSIQIMIRNARFISTVNKNAFFCFESLFKYLNSHNKSA